MRTWLLVANGVHGRLFKVNKKAGRLIEIKDFLNPRARLYERQLTSDAPGKVFDCEGSGRHAVEQHAKTKEQLKEQFSHNLVKYLDAKYKTEKINHLVIIAPSKILGYMNKKFSKTGCSRVTTKIAKDVTGLPDKEIFIVLKKELLAHKVY